MSDEPERTYFVVSADNLADLQQMVERSIADGWAPIGGVAVKKSHEVFNRSRFYQALLRHPPMTIGGAPVRYGTLEDLVEQATKPIPQGTQNSKVVHLLSGALDAWGPDCDLGADDETSANLAGTNCPFCVEEFRYHHAQSAKRASDRQLELQQESD